MTQWFYMKDGLEVGPISTSELKRIAACGELSPTDTIWREGLEAWIPASKAKGLFQLTSPRETSAVQKQDTPEIAENPQKNKGLIWYAGMWWGWLSKTFEAACLNVLSPASADPREMTTPTKVISTSTSSSSEPLGMQRVAVQYPGMSFGDPRPYCLKCRQHVSPQVVSTTKNVGPTMLIDTGGPVDFIRRNSQSMVHKYCSVCGSEVCSVEHCPRCRCFIPAKIEYHRYSGFSWEQAPMGFCSQCREQVSGPPKSDCFIATAAYGCPLAPEVQRLRDFRDDSLMPHPLGRLFVNWYYQTSPPIADWVGKSAILRAITRFAIRIALSCVGDRR